MTEIIEREITPEEEAEREEWAAGQYDRDYAAVQEARRQAYVRISDPIYMQWKRGLKTEQEWLDAVAQVEKNFPVPEVAI